MNPDRMTTTTTTVGLDGMVAMFVADGVATGVYNGKSPAIIRERLTLLARHYGERPVAELDRAAVTGWLASCATLRPASRAAYASAARSFCRWLVRHGHLEADPMADLGRVRVPKAVPRAQSSDAVRRLLAVCTSERDRCIVLMEAGLGLRRAEVAAARWENYDVSTATLIVLGKGGHERTVPVPPFVADAMEACRNGATVGPIVASEKDGSHLTPAYVGSIVAARMRDAGLKRAAYDGVSGHALRHTAATDTLDASGGELRVVQQLLGHRNLATTAGYLDVVNLDRMREAMHARAYLDEAA